MTSWRVGHETFLSSARTSRTNSRGFVRSVLRFWAGALRSRVACEPSALTCPARCAARFCSRFIAIVGDLFEGVEQGRRDSNPQPPVLETGALPIEPLP